MKLVPLVLALLSAPPVSAQGQSLVQNANSATALRRAPDAPLLDPFPASTTAASITLTGTAPLALTVDIMAPSGNLSVPVVDTAFSALVPLDPDQVNAIHLVARGSQGVESAPRTAFVTHDGEDPDVFIDFPLAGDVITTSDFVDVAGRVGDRLSGFDGLTVDVNGVQAAVDIGLGSNGTFLAQNVPLIVADPPLPTLIVATATDALGNQATAEISVTRVSAQPGEMFLEVVSGDGQSGPIGTVLGAPLAVRVLQGDGVTPLPGKLVSFEVQKSDGLLAATGSGGGALRLDATTDASGVARAFLELGSDAGCGNNRVEARSTGVFGVARFCASATPGRPARILIGTGDNQVVEAGAPAPLPLEAWVNDACNGIAGVPVTFTVLSGGGTVNGLASAVVNTGATGHAAALFQVGPQAGTQVVRADFAGNTEAPVLFTTTAIARDAAQSTRFVGLVLDSVGRAVGGAAVRLDIGGQRVASTTTDVFGQFFLEDLPVAGPGHLEIDGLVATTLEGRSTPPGSLPRLGFLVTVVPNATNRLPLPSRLPLLDPANEVPFDNTEDVVLTVAGWPGFEMTVRAGSVTRADGSVPAPGDPIVLSLNSVDFNEIPMPLPNGAASPLAWTLQPGGTRFDPPVEVRMPNAVGLPPGAVGYVLSFDHDVERFDIVASGSVTRDGAYLVSDPGAGIATAGWGGGCPPYPPVNRADGRLADTWGASQSFLKSAIQFFSLAENPCWRFQDGTPEGEVLRSVCIQNGLACALQTAQLAGSVPGTFSTSGPPDLGGVQEFLSNELQTVLNEAGGGAQLSPGVAQILNSASVQLQAIMPGRITTFDARVTMQTPYPFAVGQGIMRGSLGAFGLDERAVAIASITTVESPTSVLFEGIVIEPAIEPVATGSVGGSTRPVNIGSFALPNVPLQGPVRPLITYVLDGARFVAGPATFLAPNPGGVTDFGAITLDVEARLRAALGIAPGSVGFNALGDTQQLSVTATLDDGSVIDATPFTQGSAYASSNSAIAGVDSGGLVTANGPGIAFITVVNEGTAAIAPVVVSPGDPLTELVGVVLTPAGAPANGAQVTALPGGLPATTAADGSFSIQNAPTLLGDFDVFVYDQATASVGNVTGVVPDPEGATDAGVIQPVPAVSWIVDASGDWEDGANWSTGSPPAPGDSVVIDRPAGNYTITVNTAAIDVEMLICTETLRLVGGSLTSTAPVALESVTLNGGTLVDVRVAGSPAALLTVGTGGGTLDGVQLGIDALVPGLATLQVVNGLAIDGGREIEVRRNGSQLATVEFVGAQTLAGDGDIRFASTFFGDGSRLLVTGGPLTVEAGITLLGSAPQIGSVGAPLVLRGTLRVTGGTGDVFSPLVNQDGTYRAASGASLFLREDIDNAGSTLHVDGTVQLVGAALNGGSVVGEAGSVLRISQLTDNRLDGVTLDVDLDVLAQTLVEVLNGLTLLNGHTITLSRNGSQDATLDFVGPQALAGDGEVIFVNSFGGFGCRLRVTGGPLTIEPGIKLRGNRPQIGTSGETIIQRGTLCATVGTLRVLGVTVNDGGAYLADPGALLLFQEDVDNAGQVLALGGEVELSGAALVGGTVTGGAGTLLYVSQLADNLLDGVTFDVDVQLRTNTLVPVENGLTLLNGHTITLQRNGSHNATLDFVGPQTLAGNGEVVFLNTFGGAGCRVQVTGGPLTIEPGLTLRGNAPQIGTSGETIVQHGTLRATTGALDVIGVLDNRSGSYLADPGAQVFFLEDVLNVGETLSLSGEAEVSSATVFGGLITGTPGAELFFSSAGNVLDGVTLDVDAFVRSNTSVGVTNGLTLANDHVVNFGSSGSLVGLLNFIGPQTLGGTGQVVPSGSGGFQPGGIAVTGGPLTVDRGITITTLRGRLGSSGEELVLLGSLSVLANGTASAPGALTLAGTTDIASGGALNVTGALSQTGGTTALAGGTLNPAGSFGLARGTFGGFGTLAGDLVATGGTIEVGGAAAAGTLDVNGAFDMGPAVTLAIELGGLVAGTEHDVLDVSGAATFAGTLDVATLGGFAPTTGDAFDAATYASASGAFGSVLGTPVSVTFGANALTLTAN